MSLSPGARLGPYEIVAPLGAGGMGEVYRAKDTRLGRDVAIKVLPAEVATDPDRLRRFELEARAASALNHPNIVTVHEVGSSEAGPYLVLEKIDGRSLHDLLRDGPMPIKRLLALATQIAEGLAKAHAAGIVHRDLKPANVMVTDDGFAKILDFGLARLTYPELESGQLGRATTIAEPTASGMILGTPGYLSPEQAAGRTADFRSDQFALGALLYEMASGERPFGGSTAGEALAAVLRDDPEPIRTKNPSVPAPLAWLVDRCLAKDPNERYASTKDLARDLGDLSDNLSELSRAANSGAAGAARAQDARPRIAPREALAWGLALALVVALVGSLLRRPPGPLQQPPLVRSSLVAPEGQRFDFSEGAPALSPDGRRVVFIARDADGKRRLWLRALSSLEAQPLALTEGATHPFWAPDGSALAFFQNAELRRLDLTSGDSRALCEVEATARGGAWSAGGTILFAPSGRDSIFRVPATGGKPVRVTELDEKAGQWTHRFPSFLPGGSRFLFLAAGEAEPTVFVGSVEGGERLALLPADSAAIYSPSGHLLFLRQDTLYAQSFDPVKLVLTGEPIRIAEQVQSSSRNEAALSVAANGALLFQTGLGTRRRQLTWLDREGRLLEPIGLPLHGGPLALSHDGKRAALVIFDAKGARDIWVKDLERGTTTRLSFDPGHEFYPVWSFDDQRVFYGRQLDDRSDIVSKASDGSGADEVVLAAAAGHYLLPQSVAADGKTLAIAEATETAGGVDDYGIALLRLPDGTPVPFGKPAFQERNAQIAPDGRWLAYESDESGRNEIYLEALGGARGRLQLSSSGGTHPRWRQDGSELFYLSTELKLVAVPLRRAKSLDAGEPRVLFEPSVPGGSIDFLYDVAPDGQRFLFARTVRGQSEPPLTLVANWTAELARP